MKTLEMPLSNPFQSLAIARAESVGRRSRAWTRGFALVVASSLLLVTSAEGTERHVPAEFPTIQAAVDAANYGDEVVVAAGEYDQPVTIKKHLLGVRTTGKVVLVGGASLQIEQSSLVTIDGIRVSQSSGVGIRVTNSSEVLLRNCRVDDPGAHGIYVIGSTRVFLADPQVHMAEFSAFSGLWIGTTQSAEVTGAKIRGGLASVEVSDSPRIQISGSNLRFAGQGIRVAGGCVPMTIAGNVIRDMTQSGIASSSGGAVLRNRIEYVATGISVEGASTSVMENEITMATSAGIFVDNDDAHLSSNEITACEIGIEVAIVDRVVLFENTIKKSAGRGIVFDGDAGVIAYNKVTKSGTEDLAIDVLKNNRVFANKFKSP